MKKNILSIGTLAFILTAFVIPLNEVSAYRGDSTVQGPNYSVERHEAMEKAFTENDYEAWKNLMENRGRITQLINKENFSKFSEAHNLMREGKIEEAQQIRKEIGIGQNNLDHQKGSGMKRDGMGRKYNR